MLVLSRRVQESIRIDDQIVITVLRIKGSAVRIGIDAPPAIRIIRDELKPIQTTAATSIAPLIVQEVS